MSAGGRRVFTTIPWQGFPSGVSLDVPEYFNIAQACLISHAEEVPNAIAIMDHGVTPRIWTYQEMSQSALKLANVWRRAGVQKGDRVAILLPQCAETMIAHFAAHLIGAISLPLFVLFGTAALKFRLSDSGAKVLVTDKMQFAKIHQIHPDLPNLKYVYLRDGIEHGSLDLWSSLNRASPLEKFEPTLSDDPAMMIYTSGTTGDPKGVLHAHRFLLGHLPCIEVSFKDFPNAQDVGWTPADWAWIGGLMDMVIPCFYYRVPLIAKRFERFTAQAAFNLIRDADVTRAFLPPTALKMMRKGEVPDGVKLVSISSGGEPLSDDLIVWAKSTLGAEVNELYGQTECNLSVGSARSLNVVQPGWIGKAFPGFDVQIMTEGGEVCDDNAVGEICVHKNTPSMFLRYWNQPKKTAERFLGDYLKTGDLGRKDAAGFVQFIARDDDVITSSGYRIGPTEIEASLSADPKVVLAAAIAVPDATRGHVIGAYVTVSGPVAHDFEAKLIERISNDISPHMTPRWVRIIQDMPMTTTGKIRRIELREMAAQGPALKQTVE